MNKIFSLVDSNGDVKTTLKEMSKAVTYYKDILGSSVDVKDFHDDINLAGLSSMQAETLGKDLTEIDV